MKRRAFLQSLLAGTAALTLPKSVEAIRQEKDGRTLEERQYDFELYGETAHLAFELTVPGGGRAVTTVHVPEDLYVQVVSMAFHVRDGRPPVTVSMPSTIAIPMPCTVFDTEAPLQSPVFTKDVPIELTLEARSPEDSEVVVALFLHCGKPMSYSPVTHLGKGEIS